MQPTSYTIYNASAGSGKTYSLAKSYLRIVLGSKNPELFRNLLAITFTNKAVFEMKSRIIEYLTVFSSEKSLFQPDSMFLELSKELKIAPMELQMRSQVVLKHILHNYAAFSVSTIDGFNHQLIRNFAFDLRLNQFFEVQLDSKTLLQRAVDNLLNRAGTDEELTELLTDFSKEKIKEDKNWDISRELLQVANMLTNENHYWEFNSLKNKNLDDFHLLKKTLQQIRKTSVITIQNISNAFLNLLAENGLDRTAFYRGLIFSFFEKLSQNPEKEPSSWESDWQESLVNGEELYTKKYKESGNPSLVDSLQPQFINYFLEVKSAFGRMNFAKNALRFVIPLALLNRIQNEIEIIKEEENILPIWEFNGLIFNELSSQPAPFIYERIGERYRHYFIDEFQDTSILQWENLIPLILNALQSETIGKQRGSLLLVGDAKQSIYRWRGGKAEQFMQLYSGAKNPFFVKGEVLNLEENYRSLEKIISFNNDFFRFISDKFQSEQYRNLYQNTQQNYPEVKRQKNLPEGYVSIQFVDLELDEEENNESEITENPLLETFNERELIYCQAILETINRANEAGATDRDITILVRSNREGSAVASFLSSKGRNIISPDSLLLKNVTSIRFLISLLNLLHNPKSEELKAKMLFEFVAMKNPQNMHQFIVKYLDEPIDIFFSDYGFSLQQFNAYSIFEGVAFAINCFDLAKDSDAYLTHFMDLIFDFKNTNKGGLADFLTFWEEEKDKLSISSPEGLNAITIMTIHKSKGLSSPVIIYAFADNKLIESRSETIWYPVDKERFSGFEKLLIQTSKSLVNFEPETQEIILQYQEQNLLDQINVLYVAMTRPESFLYVISSLPQNPEKEAKTETYGTLLKHFLEEKRIWADSKTHYEFGAPIFPLQKEDKTTETDTLIHFQKGWSVPNYKIATGASFLWDTSQKEAIEKGNLIHELLSKVIYYDDLEKVMEKYLEEGILSDTQYQVIYPQLFSLINNPQIKDFFTEKYEYFIEREFVTELGKYFRPDRIVFDRKSKQAIIIDYKTGKPSDKYQKQMQNYALHLSKLGWEVIRKYLVYLEEGEVMQC